jgi:predicted dehydrogenase
MNAPAAADPFRIAIAGVSHGHVKIFNRSPFADRMALVGVHEADDTLRRAYGARYDLDAGLLFGDLGDMLDATKPEAVCAFGSIADHLEVVRQAAPRGVHVMVEKPLAFSVTDAEEMARLARQHGIHLLTNYETTWYASTHRLLRSARAGDFGRVHKVVVHDGHPGPIEIGCEPEFVAWLTNPAQSGGGALVDFGCYGANLMTSLMGGVPPRRVTAVTRNVKPELYETVEDDATILLDYGSADAVIQASWAWPVSRKDIEIYGADGQATAPDGTQTLSRHRDTPLVETREILKPLVHPLNDPFAHLAAVVRGTLVLESDDLAGLENNLVVVRILDAARRSAAEGRTVSFQGEIS